MLAPCDGQVTALIVERNAPVQHVIENGCDLLVELEFLRTFSVAEQIVPVFQFTVTVDPFPPGCGADRWQSRRHR